MNGSDFIENSCFRWFIGPRSSAKLLIINTLPRVYSNANFRALKTSTGIYSPARQKQRQPIKSVPVKPMIRCFLDRLGKQESLAASVNQLLVPLLEAGGSELLLPGLSNFLRDSVLANIELSFLASLRLR